MSLSIIVKFNVNRGAKWQGSEMEDHVQPIGLVLLQCVNDFTVIKGGTRASECIECSENLLFLYEIFQIDSNNQTC